ncbi:hypothetical protein B0H14DRAFT_718163 [Mycena olivaceomarginata]|nr:hypothetical protein B0H14DRAFT_718163 [Mycena olivaceomarginata]
MSPPCKTPGFTTSLADVQLSLSGVTALSLPIAASALQRVCPNVRCVGGLGGALIGALTRDIEMLDGMLDWTDAELADRLIKRAPNLRMLELRRPVNWGVGIDSQNTAARGVGERIPRLAALPKLTTLRLTSPRRRRRMTTWRRSLPHASCCATRDRRVLARRYTKKPEADPLHRSSTEVFG